MPRPPPALILGAFATPLTSSPPARGAVALCVSALAGALDDARLPASAVDALVTAPTLSPGAALAGHRLAQAAGLGGGGGGKPFPLVRSLDACGAAGVACLLEARALVRSGAATAVAVVLGDAVSPHSLPTPAFLERADAAVGGAEAGPAHPALASPSIPLGYGQVAAWAVESGRVRRGDLAAYAALAALHGTRHPGGLASRDAARKREAGGGGGGGGGGGAHHHHHPPPVPPLTADGVLAASREIAPATTLLECARRADGAAAVIVGAAPSVAPDAPRPVRIAGGGRASGPLTPAHPLSDDAFSAIERAASAAYADAGLADAGAVDVFYPYDCYPITALAGLAALRAAGDGGAPPSSFSARLTAAGRAAAAAHSALLDPGGGPGAAAPAAAWPVNTHGGLLGGGAPWAAPALFAVVEAVAQLRGGAGALRQVPGARVAVVHGNGGVLSEQAVAVLAAT